MSIKNQELVDVYQDTIEWVKEIGYDGGATSKKHYLEPEKKPIPIEVIDSDTVSCLLSFPKHKLKTCILNLASAKHAGGGVKNGAKSQEEDLFRCSTLPLDISQKMYPLKEDEFIYTQDAMFIKDANYERLPMKQHRSVDVVTVPAVNLNSNSYWDEDRRDWVDKIEEIPPNYESIMKRKIKTMFESALFHNCKCIILGAWGCGVFKNKPEDVSRFFKEVIQENAYDRRFKRIIFAIINDKNSRGDNFGVFKNTFK